MIGVVLDASAAGALLFPEPHTAKVHEWLERARDGRARLTSPAFLQVELANIVWKRARRVRAAAAVVTVLLQAIVQLPIRLLPDRELLARALEIGLSVPCSVYDGLYLAASEMEGAGLVTADRRLARAVSDAGLPIPVHLLGARA